MAAARLSARAQEHQRPNHGQNTGVGGWGADFRGREGGGDSSLTPSSDWSDWFRARDLVEWRAVEVPPHLSVRVQTWRNVKFSAVVRREFRSFTERETSKYT